MYFPWGVMQFTFAKKKRSTSPSLNKTVSNDKTISGFPILLFSDDTFANNLSEDPPSGQSFFTQREMASI